VKRTFRHLRSRPRLVGSLLAGCVVAALLPGDLRWITRVLIGWNLTVWLYLLLIGAMMLRADHDRLYRAALAQAENAATVLGLVVVASVASLVGVVLELSAVKVPGARHALPHVLFALSTVTGGWLLLPTLFTQTYASAYHKSEGEGLRFPDRDQAFRPSYSDFLYFAFTIAVASQTADVSVTSPSLRRLVLLQSVLSFAFNAAVLALTINIAASLF
jgi:uncharacterized membrane protein